MSVLFEAIFSYNYITGYNKQFEWKKILRRRSDRFLEVFKNVVFDTPRNIGYGYVFLGVIKKKSSLLHITLPHVGNLHVYGGKFFLTEILEK